MGFSGIYINFLITDQTHKLYCGYPFEAYGKCLEQVLSVCVWTKNKGFNIRHCKFKMEIEVSIKALHCLAPKDNYLSFIDLFYYGKP